MLNNSNEKKHYVVKVIKSKRDKENDKRIPTDVLGSYTGIPYDGEVPEQDPDDL